MKTTPFQKDLDKAIVMIEKNIRRSGFRDEYSILKPQIGLILGTGWKNSLLMDTLDLQIPLKDVPGFEALGYLDGHDRILQIGFVNERLCVVLRGRCHLNEWVPSNEDIFRMTRLQVELLIALGAETLILTNAAGSLRDDLIPGSVVVIDGFVFSEAGAMPLVAGEFVRAHTALDEKLRDVVIRAADKTQYPAEVRIGGYIMRRGPNFEEPYEKEHLAKYHDNVISIGMSTGPEALVAAWHGVKVLPVSFISNDMHSSHSHKEIQEMADKFAPYLGKLLFATIGNISIPTRMIYS